jgi:hypothetical protein
VGISAGSIIGSGRKQPDFNQARWETLFDADYSPHVLDTSCPIPSSTAGPVVAGPSQRPRRSSIYQADDEGARSGDIGPSGSRAASTDLSSFRQSETPSAQLNPTTDPPGSSRRAKGKGRAMPNKRPRGQQGGLEQMAAAAINALGSNSGPSAA